MEQGAKVHNEKQGKDVTTAAVNLLSQLVWICVQFSQIQMRFPSRGMAAGLTCQFRKLEGSRGGNHNLNWPCTVDEPIGDQPTSPSHCKTPLGHMYDNIPVATLTQHFISPV
jgi:hypothetical protein